MQCTQEFTKLSSLQCCLIGAYNPMPTYVIFHLIGKIHMIRDDEIVKEEGVKKLFHFFNDLAWLKTLISSNWFSCA